MRATTLSFARASGSNPSLSMFTSTSTMCTDTLPSGSPGRGSPQLDPVRRRWSKTISVSRSDSGCRISERGYRELLTALPSSQTVFGDLQTTVLGDHVFDDFSGYRRDSSIGPQHLDESDHGLPKRPATTPSPGRLIYGKTCAESVPAPARKQGPCNRHVASGIANSRGSEVDDSAQAAIANKEVPSADISVDPDWRVVPCRAERCVPHFGRAFDIDLVAQDYDRMSGFAVVGGRRPTAKEVVRPGRRTASGIDLV